MRFTRRLLLAPTLLALSLAAPLHSTARAADDAAAALALGQPAPLSDVKLKAVDGRALSIAEAAGKKGTLVIFICNHCPWVKAWQGRIASIGNAALTHGVGVIAVNSNDPVALPEDDFAGMQARAKLLGLKFPYAMDESSDIARRFGATHTPEAFLFDAAGKLVYHGAVDDNARNEQAVQKRWLEDAVNAVASGKHVAVAETKAFGCGIKLRQKAGSAS